VAELFFNSFFYLLFTVNSFFLFLTSILDLNTTKGIRYPKIFTTFFIFF